MTFDEALKKMRRAIYVHGDKWRTAVLAPNPHILNVAFDEARFLIEASSLSAERATYATRTIEVERGGIMRFICIADSLDQFKLSGQVFQQIIILKGSYPGQALEYIRHTLRSPHIPADQLLWQEGVAI